VSGSSNLPEQQLQGEQLEHSYRPACTKGQLDHVQQDGRHARCPHLHSEKERREPKEQDEQGEEKVEFLSHLTPFSLQLQDPSPAVIFGGLLRTGWNATEFKTWSYAPGVEANSPTTLLKFNWTAFQSSSFRKGERRERREKREAKKR
jgi:hypothetical protein